MSAALSGAETSSVPPRPGRVWAWTVVVWIVLGGGTVVLAQSMLIPPGPGLHAPLGGPYPSFALALVAGALFVIGAPAMVRTTLTGRRVWRRSRAMDGARRRRLARCVRAVHPVAGAEREDAVVVARAMLHLDHQAVFTAGLAVMVVSMGVHVGLLWQMTLLMVAGAVLLIQIAARRVATPRVRRWVDLHAHPA